MTSTRLVHSRAVCCSIVFMTCLRNPALCCFRFQNVPKRPWSLSALRVTRSYRLREKIDVIPTCPLFDRPRPSPAHRATAQLLVILRYHQSIIDFLTPPTSHIACYSPLNLGHSIALYHSRYSSDNVVETADPICDVFQRARA